MQIMTFKFNPYTTGSTPVCSWLFETTEYISTKFSRNAENLEEMFLRYWYKSKSSKEIH